MSESAIARGVPINGPLRLEAGEPSRARVATGLTLLAVSVLGVSLFWDNIVSLRKPLQFASFAAAAEGFVFGSALTVYELCLKERPFVDRSASLSGVLVTPRERASESSQADDGILDGYAPPASDEELQARKEPASEVMARLAQANSREGKLAASAYENILNGRVPLGVTILSKGCNRVFTIDSIPGVIFKAHTGRDGRPITGDVATYCNKKLERRWNNINACREFLEDRPHLIIPNAVKLRCDGLIVNGEQETRNLLACKRYQVNVSGVQVEADFTWWCENRPEEFAEAICELIGFICDTGYKDVCFRNNPVVEIDGKPRIILLDLEYCAVDRSRSEKDYNWCVAGGLWMGDHDARGLCRQLTPEMARRVRDAVPREHLTGWDQATARRQHELEKRERAVTWMQSNGVTNENRIEIPESAAQLATLSEEQQGLALELIQQANKQIRTAGSWRPLWSQRQLYIRREDPVLPHAEMKPVIKELKKAGHIFGKMPAEEINVDHRGKELRKRRRYRVLF